MIFYPHSPFIKHPQLTTKLFRDVKTEYLKDLAQWLCLSPKLTTIRVNLLKSTRSSVQQIIVEKLSSKYTTPPLVIAPDVFPELLVIQSSSCPSPQLNPTLNEIIVDACCGAALLRGAHIYAPGVIAMATHSKLDEVVNVFADLEGKCLKGTTTKYVSDTKTFIGEGRIKMQRYQLFGDQLQPDGIAVEMISTVSGVPSIGDAYLPKGTALLQNFPSIVCSRVLNPQAGDVVLDMCAAPGNKTTHLGELMKDTGVLIALDKNANKLKQLQENVGPFGLATLKCFAYDSTRALAPKNSSTASSTSLETGPPFAECSFDKILLDAPCSALGNRPQLSNKINEKVLQSFPAVQKKLFTNAVGLLKKNGILVYSTCTVAQAENEDIVAWALQKFPELKLIEASPIFGSPGVEGSDLDEIQRNMVQRFGPDNKQWDSVGFFIAKLMKS